ncbi:hypothetical protein HYU19_02815 [Candidatus Woesearchaeota archaeon]|nr:hypothetical protein [Candidatus Woesearchaeota archaeon]
MAIGGAAGSLVAISVDLYRHHSVQDIFSSLMRCGGYGRDYVDNVNYGDR